MADLPPTPWHVETCTDVAAVLNRDGYEVCVVDHQELAQLIAAAPELLAAAHKVWEAREEAFDSRVGNYYGPLGQSLLALRDAIKKAEGAND